MSNTLKRECDDCHIDLTYTSGHICRDVVTDLPLQIQDLTYNVGTAVSLLCSAPNNGDYSAYLRSAIGCIERELARLA